MFSRLQNHEQDNYRASLVAASLNYQGTSTFIISNTCQQEKKNRKIGKKKKKGKCQANHRCTERHDYYMIIIFPTPPPCFPPLAMALLQAHWKPACLLPPRQACGSLCALCLLSPLSSSVSTPQLLRGGPLVAGHSHDQAQAPAAHGPPGAQ